MFAREDQHMEREDMDVVEGFWENAGDETPSQSAHASSRLTSRLYLLAATKFVSHLDAAAFAELYAKLEWLHLQPGEHLFAHDDAGDDGMFVVIRGSLGVYRDGTLISQYVRGESCGEFSMLTGARRIHTVKALSEVQLIKLPAALFSQFVAQRPGAFVSFMLTNVIRQWRLAHFVLHDFFRLSPPNQPPEVIVRTTSSDPSTVFAAAAACPQSSNHISIGSNSLGIVRFDCDSELFTELKSQTDRLKFAPGEV
jgi:CRP-like cAMP-binding protein